MIAERRRRVQELRRRVLDGSGLGLPVPLVSGPIAVLLADLVNELESCLRELEHHEARASGDR